MRFMLIAKIDETSNAAPPTPELMAAIGKLTDDMARDGKMIHAGGLMPSAQGALLALSGGKITVTDGPFAEAKELIGGFAIVEVNSKEEAVGLARRFLQIHADVMGPSYKLQSEIRQMYDPSDVPGKP